MSTTETPHFRIRRATLADAQTLMPFARQCFSDTYVGHPKSNADPVAREAYMAEAFTEQQFAKEFQEVNDPSTYQGPFCYRDGPCNVFLVCEEDYAENDDGGDGSQQPQTSTRLLGYAKVGIGAHDEGVKYDRLTFDAAATDDDRKEAEEVGGHTDSFGQSPAIDRCRPTARPIRLYRLYAGKAFIGRRGVGSALLKAAYGVAAEHRCNLMWLGTWGENTPAVEFYAKNGFEVSGEIYFQQGYQRRVNLLMQRNL